MLDVDMVSRCGILFVRLFGTLNKDTSKEFNKKVTKILHDVGVNNIVINIQNLSFDAYGLNQIKKCYKMCRDSHLCINPNQIPKIENMRYIIDETLVIN